MENYEMTTVTENYEATTEPENNYETLPSNSLGWKDAVMVAGGTLVVASVTKGIAKKVKPWFVRWAAKFISKNGYTVASDEELECYEASMEKETDEEETED